MPSTCKSASRLASLLADLHVEGKDYEAALSCYEEASQRCQKLGDHDAYATLLGKVGEIRLLSGASRASVQQLQAACQRLRELGSFSAETRLRRKASEFSQPLTGRLKLLNTGTAGSA